MSSLDFGTTTDDSSLSESESDDRPKIARNHGKLLRDLNGMLSDARQARYPFEKQWYLNMAFFFGRQWVTWQRGASSTSVATRLVEPPAPPWRVRLVINKIRPFIRGELSKVTQENPRFFVIPKTTEEEDVFAARAGEQVAEHLWRELGMRKTIRRAVFWELICGSAFIKDWHDPKKVDTEGIQGAIQATHVTPFHILLPIIEVEELEEQPYIIHMMAKTPDWVKETYGEDIKPDSTSGDNIQVLNKFMSALGIKVGTEKKKNVAINEIWIKPNSEFPEGAVITWTKNKILEIVEGWPYEHDEFPFTRLDHIPSGKCYGDSIIVDLIPLQKEYNRTRSQIIESKNRMSKPQIMAPKGSIDPNRITTEPGLIITYQPGFPPPTPLPLQNLPAYVLQELDRIQKDMDDISAQHEVSKGQVPPGVEAATAISFLQEQDDSKLAPTINSLEEGIEKIGAHFLSHVKQFWNAERTIRVLGDNGVWETALLLGTDLNGNTNVKVEAGSATPKSRAGKQAFFTELADKGFISPDKMLKYLDIGEAGKLYDELQTDVRQANRENIAMQKTGQAVPVNTWDNHLTHIVEHDNYRKRQEFAQLDPQMKMAFEQHSQQHHIALGAELGIPLTGTGRLPFEVLLQLTAGGTIG